jgi:hypothetical protein
MRWVVDVPNVERRRYRGPTRRSDPGSGAIRSAMSAAIRAAERPAWGRRDRPRLVDMKRRRHRDERFPVLDGETRRVVNDDPSRARSTWYAMGLPITGPQKVRVKRVHPPIIGHRSAGRGQCLGGDLAAEHFDRRRRGRVSTMLQIEQLDEPVQGRCDRVDRRGSPWVILGSG